MKLDEFEKIVQGMTERPWYKGRDDMTSYMETPLDPNGPIRPCKFVYTPDESIDLIVWSDTPHEDAKAIAALRNHAEDLIELWRACEVYRKELESEKGPDDYSAIERALEKLERNGGEGDK